MVYGLPSQLPTGVTHDKNLVLPQIIFSRGFKIITFLCVTTTSSNGTHIHANGGYCNVGNYIDLRGFPSPLIFMNVGGMKAQFVTPDEPLLYG